VPLLHIQSLESRDRELGKLDAAVSDLKSGLMEQQLVSPVVLLAGACRAAC
jgi:hypothetical protein